MEANNPPKISIKPQQTEFAECDDASVYRLACRGARVWGFRAAGVAWYIDREWRCRGWRGISTGSGGVESIDAARRDFPRRDILYSMGSR